MSRKLTEDLITGYVVPKYERTFSGDRGTDRMNKVKTDYNDDVVKAQNARNTQRLDTDPKIEKEGFLGMDDLDRLRRRKIGKIF